MYSTDFLNKKAKERYLTKTQTETFVEVFQNIEKKNKDFATKFNIELSSFNSRMEGIYVKFGFPDGKGAGKRNKLLDLLNQEWEEERNKEQESPIFSVSTNNGDKKYDFSSAPDITNFYGCTEELEKLRKWVIDDNDRLIVLHGVTGIGKTYLARHFAETVQDKFQCVIWHSLLSYAPLKPNEYLTKLLQKFHEWFSSEAIDISEARFDELLDKLMYYLTNYRCLLILDEFQDVLKEKERVGTYQDGYQGYGELLLRIGQSSKIKSCLLLNSWDKPQGLDRLERKAFTTFQFKGSQETCLKILSEYKFLDSHLYEKLIDRYERNPLHLKGIADKIVNSYQGSIHDFLCENTYIKTNDYFSQMAKQVKRLSPMEVQVIKYLPENNQTMSLEELQQQSELVNERKSKLMTVLDDSLVAYRSLIHKTTQGYTISPLIKRVVEEVYP